MKNNSHLYLSGMHPYYTNGRYQCPQTGLMLPWYTRGALEYLLKHDLSNKSVFEFGVGYGTPWYKVVSEFHVGVDDSQVWAKAMGVAHEKEIQGYLNVIYKFPLFDVVIVDGAWRKECIEHAIERLKPGGIIIADNWNQPSSEVDWGNTEERMSIYPSQIFHEENHPDWKTIIWQL